MPFLRYCLESSLGAQHERNGNKHGTPTCVLKLQIVSYTNIRPASYAEFARALHAHDFAFHDVVASLDGLLEQSWQAGSCRLLWACRVMGEEGEVPLGIGARPSCSCWYDAQPSQCVFPAPLLSCAGLCQRGLFLFFSKALATPATSCFHARVRALPRAKFTPVAMVVTRGSVRRLSHHTCPHHKVF